MTENMQFRPYSYPCFFTLLFDCLTICRYLHTQGQYNDNKTVCVGCLNTDFTHTYFMIYLSKQLLNFHRTQFNNCCRFSYIDFLHFPHALWNTTGL